VTDTPGEPDPKQMLLAMIQSIPTVPHGCTWVLDDVSYEDSDNQTQYRSILTMITPMGSVNRFWFDANALSNLGVAMLEHAKTLRTEGKKLIVAHDMPGREPSAEAARKVFEGNQR